MGSIKNNCVFGALLKKAQKNIQTGLGQLDDEVGMRTRAEYGIIKNTGVAIILFYTNDVVDFDHFADVNKTILKYTCINYI